MVASVSLRIFGAMVEVAMVRDNRGIKNINWVSGLKWLTLALTMKSRFAN
jgi:hypothetical protein